MGKLAERYQDAARSGVYRVERAEIPLRAASEAHAQVWEIDAANLDGMDLEQRIRAAGRQPHVVLVRVMPAAAAHLHALVVETLGAIARACRADGIPLFAVMVDPAGALALPPLYKERLSAPSDR